jgi:hypothetical protein
MKRVGKFFLLLAAACFLLAAYVMFSMAHSVVFAASSEVSGLSLGVDRILQPISTILGFAQIAFLTLAGLIAGVLGSAMTWPDSAEFMRSGYSQGMGSSMPAPQSGGEDIYRQMIADTADLESYPC